MKIINFVLHNPPILTGMKKGWKQLASFEVEFPMAGITLIWRGWSVRQLADHPAFLQAPKLYNFSSTSAEPMIKIEKIPPALMLKMMRAQIKLNHGIEIPEPPAPNKRPDRKKIFKEREKKNDKENEGKKNGRKECEENNNSHQAIQR